MVVSFVYAHTAPKAPQYKTCSKILHSPSNVEEMEFCQELYRPETMGGAPCGTLEVRCDGKVIYYW